MRIYLKRLPPAVVLLLAALFALVALAVAVLAARHGATPHLGAIYGDAPIRHSGHAAV